MGFRAVRLLASIVIIAVGWLVAPTLVVLLLIAMLFGWAIGRGISAGK